jgi:manganese transport protein
VQSVLPRPAFALPRWLTLAGPAVAVSIGYVDPGNWASDLAAGAYGFRLLWVILAANVVAIVLQTAVTRLTIASGSDFAALIAARWPRAAPAFWGTFQLAAIATDIAEFTGIVLGAQLLFHLPVLVCVAAGFLTVYAILFTGRRRPHAFDLAMFAALAGLAGAFAFLTGALHPSAGAIVAGTLIPSIPDAGALFVVVAIVGATVMPHNLFLHSALVRDRTANVPAAERRGIRKYFVGETFVALNIAMVINGTILIVGACLGGGAKSIEEAFGALHAINASSLFGAALLVSGVAATATATLSGDYIFARFSKRHVSPFLRRTATALPAAALLLANVSPTLLLLWSQCALCLILPAAVVPLLLLLRASVPNPSAGERAFFRLCVAATVLCVALNVTLLYTSLFRG